MSSAKLGHQRPDPGWCGDPRRGAGMGRESDLHTRASLMLRQVRLVGDYDEGGAYWGGGPDVPPLWVAWDPETGDECYLRASSVEEVKTSFPDATFLPPLFHPYLEAFFSGYVECALWSTCGDDPGWEGDPCENPGGVPLDDAHGPEDLAPRCEERMRADCVSFLATCGVAIDAATFRCDGSRRFSSAGHDLWLTRNGHGAGFWDGDWSEPEATALTEAAKELGEVDLYVGDDGRIHHG